MSRRKNKPPNETFKRRSYYFSLLQKRRLDSLHGAGSGEYARLLLELTGNADAALRSELERERERRLQALIIRVKLRMLTEHFEASVAAWKSIRHRRDRNCVCSMAWRFTG